MTKIERSECMYVCACVCVVCVCVCVYVYVYMYDVKQKVLFMTLYP